MSGTSRALWILSAILVASTPHAGHAAAPDAERAAIEVARLRVEPPDRFEVLSARFGGADPVAEGPIRLELVEARGPNAAGVVSVRFRMVVNGKPDGQARVSVRGRVYGPALQVAHTLSRGALVNPEDVELRECDITRLNVSPLRDAAEFAGLVPVRTLGVDRILTPELFEPEPLVRRGQTVELRLVRPGLSVTALAEALRDGAVGEVVPATNRSSGVVVNGIVQSDGSLLWVRR